MTGTGTQNDPFVISNWADFITAVGTSGAYVEFPKAAIIRTSDTSVDPNKLYVDSTGTVQTNVQTADLPNLYENTFTLDANDYAPAGLSTTITINCASINGYGSTIKNLASTAADIFTNNTSSGNLYNLAIINFNVEDHFFIKTMNVLKCFYCIFSGRVKNSTSSLLKVFGKEDNSGNSPMTSCSLNITMDGYIDLFNYYYYDWNPYGGWHTYCRFEIHKTNNQNSSGGNLYTRAQNCYFTGEIDGNYTICFTSESQYDVVEIESSTASITRSQNISSILVNSDYFTGNNISSYCTLVDSEDLTNAQTLAALGFPIQT